MTQVGGPLICATGASASAVRRFNRGVKTGKYRKLAPGHFIDLEAHRALSPADRAKLRIVADACAAPKSFVVGASAAFLWDLPDNRSDTQRHRAPVELGRLAGRTCQRGSVFYRALRQDHGERVVSLDTDVGAVRVTDRLTTCLDLARWNNLDGALQALDHCLHKKWFTLAEVDEQVREMSGVQGINSIRQMALLASTGSESPRETTLKLLLWRLGLPAPRQQVKIFSRRGTWLGRVDFFYPDFGMIIEYDGRAKYDAPARDGRSTKEKEYDQTVAYLANGLTVVRVRSEQLSNGLAEEVIGAHVRHHAAKGLPYPRHRWSEGVPAWRTKL